MLQTNDVFCVEKNLLHMIKHLDRIKATFSLAVGIALTTNSCAIVGKCSKVILSFESFLYFEVDNI